jgi:hypothetical protein
MANYIVDAIVVIEYLITGLFTVKTQAFFDQITTAPTATPTPERLRGLNENCSEFHSGGFSNYRH